MSNGGASLSVPLGVVGGPEEDHVGTIHASLSLSCIVLRVGVGACPSVEGGREGGRVGREGGREGGRREGGREGGGKRNGRREGGRVGGREGGREGRTK